MSLVARETDSLDKLVVFLAKRDGIDKLVKTFQYVFKILNWQMQWRNKDLAERALKFEISCGLSRKAFRLGRFLTGFNNLRTAQYSDWKVASLSVVGTAGEMVYFFFDHFTWMAKVGLIDPKLAAKFAYVSAYGENFLYVAFIWLDIIMIQRGMDKEKQLKLKLLSLHKQAETLAYAAKNSPRSKDTSSNCISSCSFSPSNSRRSSLDTSTSFTHNRVATTSASQSAEDDFESVENSPKADIQGNGFTTPLLIPCTCKESRIEELLLLEGEVKQAKVALGAIHIDRVLRMMGMAGKLGDLVISVAATEPNPVCCHPLTLGISGLLSAWTGWYCVWPAKV